MTNLIPDHQSPTPGSAARGRTESCSARSAELARHADGVRRPGRRGFTLVEVLLAGMLTAFIVGSISMSLGQLGRAKASCKERLDAYLRADWALNMIRADVASVLRSDDLFDTRFKLYDRDISTPLGEMGRDELLLFNTRFRPIRSIDFNGEGSEYETQYRIEQNGDQMTLWQRRDAFPDRYPEAGGMLTPAVEGIISLDFEAYDGDQWYGDWDSDVDGLPYAVRITIIASGARPEQSPYEAVTAQLRTIVAIDRVTPPADLFRLTPEEMEELDARELIDPSAAGSGEVDQADDAEGTGSGVPASGSGFPRGGQGGGEGDFSGQGGRGVPGNGDTGDSPNRSPTTPRTRGGRR